MTIAVPREGASDPVAWALLSKAMLDPEGQQDIYPLLRRLHDHGGYFTTPDGVVVVHGYDEVAELLRSPAFLREGGSTPNPAFTTATAEEEAELQSAVQNEATFLVFLNPPDHGRVRNLVNRGFLPKHLNALRPVIQFQIDRLLGALDPSQPADIIGQFSALFAPEIVGELIGLPAEHRQKVAEYSAIFMRGIDPGASFPLRLEAAHARRLQGDYVREVIADRRAHPRDDFVTALIARSDEEKLISDPELTALIQTLYIGGYETTSHMIGNGVVALLTHPDQFALLRDDPSLARPAVEEMLRYDGPITLAQFVAGEGAELAGRPATAGATYLAVLAAANHDPAVFDRPEVFNLRRERRNILSFGGGAHFCLGAALARLELEMVFTELARRYPRMQLADEKLVRLPAFHQRAYEKVMVVLEP